MQTFLPYSDFSRSLLVLDRRRLNKQRIEAYQIWRALTDPTYGWQNHPAVLQWRGSENYLRFYGICAGIVWRELGGGDEAGLLQRMRRLPHVRDGSNLPVWLGSVSYHASHRSNLLRKDPEWYGQWGWEESADLPYVWPSKTTLLDVQRDHAPFYEPGLYEPFEEDYRLLQEMSFTETDRPYSWARLMSAYQEAIK